MSADLKDATTRELLAELAGRIGGVNAADRVWHRASCLAISKAGPEVVKLVAERTFVEPEDIMGRSRVADIATARQLAMVMLWRRGFSLVQVGNFFGRHHGTILHAIRRLRATRIATSHPQSPSPHS